MPTVFTLLSEIRERPAMFVGGDESDRGAQLRQLETLLYGYGLAVEAHGLEDPGRDFVKSFAVYVNKRFGWPTALGPIVAILDAASPSQDPWELFWKLVNDFKHYLSRGADRGHEPAH